MRTRHYSSSSNPVPSRHAQAPGAKAPRTHQTVLLHEAVELLSVVKDDIVVDATLGAAGHAQEICKHLGREGLFIGFDLDSDAIQRAEGELSAATPRTLCIQANFRNLRSELLARGVANIDKALFDLGWNSGQLEAGRGFSFLRDEPLLMTYAKEPGENALTAATIVNEWAEESIADVLFGWGQERYARRIAKRIVERRLHKPFSTSRELAEEIAKAVPPAYRKGRIHPATRSFQAIRIAVNDELGALAEGLQAAWSLLRPGGRIAVITFHSLEDRVVKRYFADLELSGGGTRINKKPLAPSREEILQNPRARSAKLRVISKHHEPASENK